MPTLREPVFLGAALAGIVLAEAPLLIVQAQTPPPALPQATELNVVNQVSDKLANRLTTSSCQDFAALLAKVQASSGQPSPDSNSVIGQLLTSVKSNSQLKAIVVNKVGEPLVTKLIDCNMVPVDALFSSP
jgi:hypothetical protein